MDIKESKLTFLRESEKRGKGNKKYAWYLCECGTEVEVRKDNARRSCGCIEESNKLALGRVECSKLTLLSISLLNGRSVGQFLCDCGKVHSKDLASVKSRGTKSCGCISKEIPRVGNKVHGMTNTVEWKTWCAIKYRCTNTKAKSYKDYGGRGIKICDRWLESFENFYKDVGSRPSKDHSIDRRDNEGNYEPSNCRWATRIEQARNRRSNAIYNINGVTRCLSEWVEIYGVSSTTTYARLKEGKSIEEALEPSRLRKG